ncbi:MULTISPECIES: hypothetical protein [Nocardia]|uniref:hypothetical protein n=1 Tax=Nocardia TaxID=1817 RepID=UPI00130092B8|nr:MULTISPECIES: hypothetical protein [Nocardia]
MSNPVPMQSITRAEYQQLLERGYAGPVSALTEDQVETDWRDRFPDWRGRNWVYLDTDDAGVLRLAPVNVTRQRRASAA